MDLLLQTESEQYKKNADALIAESGILDILKKYGEPIFVGSYAANLMMSEDIDIHILREKPFSKEETLEAFTDFFRRGSFNSYYIGDWNGTNIHPEFPDGYYIGLKTRFAGEKWKIDIWLMSKSEQEIIEREQFNVAKAVITPEQRAEILRLKRENNPKTIPSQKIYEKVLGLSLK